MPSRIYPSGSKSIRRLARSIAFASGCSRSTGWPSCQAAPSAMIAAYACPSQQAKPISKTGWLDSLRQVEAFDFDIFVPGHGPVGRKDHVRMFREYLQTLHAEVLQHARAGKTVAEVKELVKLPQYESWAGYKEMFALNVEGMYRLVQNNRRGN